MYTPSNGSRWNWIESEFTVIRCFTLDGHDYLGHHKQETAIADYTR